MNKNTIEVQVGYDSENDAEITKEVPYKFEVCSGCQGHGTRLHEAIGSHAYSMEEFQQEFDDEEAREYFTRGGIYDVTCWTCNGEKVVKHPDLTVLTDEERAWIDDSEEEEASYQRMCKAERDMGA